MAPDAGGAGRDLRGMFDQEVIDAMRRQFDAADKDGNGQLDAHEACELFAKHCCPEGAGEEEIRRTASGLVNQLDADRSGTISFEEYCFRFGRRYQVEAARRRRAGQAGSGGSSIPANNEGAASTEAGAARAAPASEPAAAPRATAAGRAAEAGRPPAAGTGGSSAGAPRAEASSQPAGGADSSPRFSVGSLVLLEGLRAAPQLNGQRAKVLRFDAGAGRYVVEIEGGGGQKSLRPENLRVAGASTAGSDMFAGATATGKRWVEKAKAGFKTAIARVQVMLAEYEWWQIALGAALVVLFVMAYFQVQGRYRGGGGGGASGRRSHSRPGASRSRYSDEHWDDNTEGREEPRSGRGRDRYRERHDNYNDDDDYDYLDRGGRHPRDRRGGGPGGGGRYSYHEQHDDDYDDGYRGGGHGGGGLLGDSGQLYTLLVLGGLGYACWTGIIPVHRMSWFQIYMLWNILEPILLGGRGRGFGGGLGRRRRGFF